MSGRNHTTRAIWADLEAGQPQRAIAAVEARRNAIASLGWRCLGALTTFHAYTSAYLEGLDTA